MKKGRKERSTCWEKREGKIEFLKRRFTTRFWPRFIIVRRRVREREREGKKWEFPVHWGADLIASTIAYLTKEEEEKEGLGEPTIRAGGEEV